MHSACAGACGDNFHAIHAVERGIGRIRSFAAGSTQAMNVGATWHNKRIRPDALYFAWCKTHWRQTESERRKLPFSRRSEMHGQPAWGLLFGLFLHIQPRGQGEGDIHRPVPTSARQSVPLLTSISSRFSTRPNNRRCGSDLVAHAGERRLRWMRQAANGIEHSQKGRDRWLRMNAVS